MMVSKSFSSLFLTLGVVAPLAGALASTACSSKFEGCASSRSCPSDAGEGGGGGSAGKGGSAGSGGGGGIAGKGGTGAMGGESGEAGGPSGKGGTSGSGGAGNAGKGGDAGSSTEPMGGEGGGSTEPEPDETPPRILSVSPADGETGVKADAVIRITFSEPMDRSSRLAYASQDLPYADVGAAWSAGDTVLTLTPNAPLSYAEGARDELDFEATPYSVGLTGLAIDKAGNSAEPMTWTFRTLRRFDQQLTATGDDVRIVAGNTNSACVPADGMRVGDTDSNRPLFGFVQFDLDDTAPNVTEWESATLWGVRTDHAGMPKDLGGIHVHEIESDIATANGATALGEDYGVFLNAIVPNAELELTDALTTSFASDGLVQFRLQTAIASNLQNPGVNDFWVLDCAFDLNLIYLAP
jgi:hypothetical protein